ncbi:hypothetical protein CLOSTHATH_03198 [Hungatella hathewayi DSM 13479]|uniref:Uncharacterized protein n=1 Tax=Hungatella hathewayi DSM 13479 TaxID=566550 RepID=D3AHV9_9FIRM|nr:hypothetical protein CLOSTHATH_03198 [Hungatella hathewayi DSM 13479]
MPQAMTTEYRRAAAPTPHGDLPPINLTGGFFHTQNQKIKFFTAAKAAESEDIIWHFSIRQ